MKVQVITLAPTRTAALRYVGPYGPGVAAFWQQHFYPFLVRNDLLGRPTYGISHDDPTRAAPEACRYDTCVEVDADFVLPAEATFVTIAGGKYAMLPFEGHHQRRLARLAGRLAARQRLPARRAAVF